MDKRNFDTEAAQWDIPPRVKLAQDIAAAIGKQVAFVPGMAMLDFGCGTGLLSLALRGRVHTVTGADSSRGMLEVFNAKLRKGKVRGVRTVWLNPEKPLNLGGPYHLVVSSMTLHHIKDIEPLLKIFYDSLGPGGQLALADLDSDGGLFHENTDGVFHNGFDREALAEMARKAGFTDVACVNATEMTKPSKDGETRTFTVFLLTAKK
jgi:2-polyprenyl-3-methyl-5-hydroxy-6-metoxy-1,4-benzoquinol methylase